MSIRKTTILLRQAGSMGCKEDCLGWRLFLWLEPHSKGGSMLKSAYRLGHSQQDPDGYSLLLFFNQDSNVVSVFR